MRKITLEVDENVMCMVINYVYDTDTGLFLDTKLVGTKDIYEGAVHKVPEVEEASNED